MAYFYTACAVRVTIFSTGPSGFEFYVVHALTQVAILMCSCNRLLGMYKNCACSFHVNELESWLLH